MKERALDQLSIGSQGLQCLITGHGLDSGCTKRAVALATGVEQRLGTAELVGSFRKPFERRRLKRDVDDFTGKALTLKPSQGLSAGAAA